MRIRAPSRCVADWHATPTEGACTQADTEENKVKDEDDEAAATLKHLDGRIFESPAFAVETAALEVVHMGQII